MVKRIQAERAGSRRHALVSPTTAIIVGVMVLMVTVASVPLAVLAHTSVIGNSVFPAGVILPFWVVGVAVARREPHNPIGWMLVGSAALVMLGLIDAEQYTVVVYSRRDALPFGPVAVIVAQCWPAALLFPPLAILLFPDGRLPSRRWRWAVWAYLASSAALIAEQVIVGLAAIIDGDVRIAPGGYLTTPAPRLLESSVFGVVGVALGVVIVVCVVAFLGRRVVSYRRARGERRQQLKWVMCGSAITAIGTPLFAFGGGLVGPVTGLAIAALPVTIGVGILKYRLYEIDVIIRRTLVYTTLVGVLAVVYLGGIYLIDHLLQTLTGQSGALAVTLSTLAAAAAFQPFQRRIQRAVDHRFYRGKYDATQTLDGFASRLRNQIELDALSADVLTVVTATLQPSHASLWLRPTRAAAPVPANPRELLR